MPSPSSAPSIGDSFIVRVTPESRFLGMGSTVLIGGHVYEKAIEGGLRVYKVEKIQLELFGGYQVFSGGKCFANGIFELIGK